MNKIGILSTILLLVLGLSVFAYVDYDDGSAQQYGSQGNYLGGAQGNFKGYYVNSNSGMAGITGFAVKTPTKTTTNPSSKTATTKAVASNLPITEATDTIGLGDYYPNKYIKLGDKYVMLMSWQPSLLKGEVRVLNEEQINKDTGMGKIGTKIDATNYKFLAKGESAVLNGINVQMLDMANPKAEKGDIWVKVKATKLTLNNQVSGKVLSIGSNPIALKTAKKEGIKASAKKEGVNTVLELKGSVNGFKIVTDTGATYLVGSDSKGNLQLQCTTDSLC